MYHQAANQFIAGYCRQTGQHANKWVLIPTNKTVSVIVTVMNEKDTIPSILEQLHRLPLREMIFVLNGSSDESFEIIRNQSSATIVHYHDPLGHDVGRAVGAKLSQSDILLFLDGDFPIYAEQLVPFMEAVANGMDIALNNITPYIGLFSERDEVTTVKEFVNMSMEQEELAANSLTAVPHAMSRHAAEVIGYANLSVPPKAQVIALNHGLKLGAPIHVDVISRNRIRKRNVGSSNIVSEMIVGDHVEAVKVVLDLKGPRLLFPDQIRNRRKVSHSDGE
jgi:glycosyltransferase involved in cell wall biosynthesis